MLDQFTRRTGRLLACWVLASCPFLVQAGQAPFLWRVEGAVTHYLMGSVHVLPAAAYPLPEPVEQAFASTEVLVLETDMAQLHAPEMQAGLLSKGMSAEGLSAEVGPQLHAQVRETLRQHELPDFLCDQLKAWMCAVTLSIQPFLSQGMDPALGVDLHFAGRAKAAGRRIVPLETVEQQLALLSDMPAGLSSRFLGATLDDLEDPLLEPQAMIQTWQRSDVATMTRIVERLRQRYPRLYQRVLAQRNHDWMPVLTDQLRSQTPVMVVVGTAHLVGPDGLVTQLREAGHSLQAVSSD